MKKIKITIADSHFLSRSGLAFLLSANNDFQLIAEALSSSDLIQQAKFYKPDLIIIDYTSSNFSIDDLDAITKRYSNSKILAITDFKSNNTISQALNAGILSHLLKDCDGDEIVEAVYKTAIGQQFMCGKIANVILDSKQTIDAYSCQGLNISEREMEIIKLIAEGLSNKEVADKLFLSTHTITTHRKNIMAKLGVNNTAGLVLFAVREELVSPNHFLFSSSN